MNFPRRVIRIAIRIGALLLFIVTVLILADVRYHVLPSSIHNRLPTHRSGHVVTDITLTTCSRANPLSSCRLPEPWVPIDKDLFLGSSWLSRGFVHYQTKAESDLSGEDPIVVDVRVSSEKPKDPPGSKSTTAALHSRWEQRLGNIWVKRVRRKYENNFHHLVTAVDVLFGQDAAEPRPGWRLIPSSIDVNGPHSVRLTARFGYESAKKHFDPSPLRIRKDGKFKILQISDIHLSTGKVDCVDLHPASDDTCIADERTIDFARAMVESEKPDLVVLSGDQVNGETSPDAQSAIFKYAKLLADLKVPYATIFGNHDNNSPASLSREESMALVSSLPYSLSQRGPPTIAGVGNYFLEVLGHSSSSSALTIYFFDTHAFLPSGPERGYGWVKDDQVAWFRHTAALLRDQHRAYSHIHLDIAFIHIPIHEYRGPVLGPSEPVPARSGGLRPVLGEYRESVMTSRRNSGLRDVLVEEGISLVSCGHDHVNSYCGLSVKDEPVPAGASEQLRPQRPAEQNKLWLCYGGGAGYGGYGGYGGYVRRVRVLEFDSQDASIKTWLRLDGESGRAEEHVLVRDGKPTY